jgi:hypothetical protein
MAIKLCDPVGEVGPIVNVAPSRLEAFERSRIGYVFNHHPAAEAVWTSLEANIQKILRPELVARIDKANVAISVPRPQLEQLASRVDCVLVGVGA